MGTDNHSDVLVVGGGIAGMTAAAYLAQAGKKVTLCEKEEKLGGLVNSFDYKGFTLDGGLRSMENSGVVLPMLRQLGIDVDFVKSRVAIGIGNDVVRIGSPESLEEYRRLLERQFPDNREDIESIMIEIVKVMEYMDVLYGIDNPLFHDMKGDTQYLYKTILPWLVKYISTMPKVAKLNQPIYEYLARFTSNRALIDLIAQHFFKDTPAFFALSYFTLYQDYLYPKGGTGKLIEAMEKYISDRGGELKTETTIVSVDAGNRVAVDSGGNKYRYRKLVWAADTQLLYRIVDLSAVKSRRAVRRIEARRGLLQGKVGGDSIFSLYLLLDLDAKYFSDVSSAHFFYTPSVKGLTFADVAELKDESGNFTTDKSRILAWLKRFMELTTYEISCPALRDETLAPKGKSGLIVSVLFEYTLAKHIRDLGWYNEFKKAASGYMIEVLGGSIYPGLKKSVIESFASSPLTIERLTGNTDGAITGWAFTNRPIPAVGSIPKVAKSVLTPIPDVFQAGQWTYSPSGLPISILTGKLASDKVLKALK